MKKIVSFKKIEHYVPGGSCGTGYSEPDKFEVTLNNGKKYKVWIDIWYRPISSIKECFVEGMNRVEEDDGYKLNKVFNSYNFQEAFKMYVDEIAETSCPYTKEEILKVNLI